MQKLFKKLIKIMMWGISAGIVLSILMVASLNFYNPSSWMWKLQRQINPPESYPAKALHQWTDIENISDNVKLAVIAAEDQLFFSHRGLDFDAILKALDANQQGKRLRGASTITQQTAKNLFLWPGRNFLRKGIEAWLSVLMEWLLGKQRILELYLNIIEFGPGIFGVESASQYYYNKTSSQLSRQQSARLAAVLPNPYRFHVNQPSNYIIKRTGWINKQMKQLGLGVLQAAR